MVLSAAHTMVRSVLTLFSVTVTARRRHRRAIGARRFRLARRNCGGIRAGCVDAQGGWVARLHARRFPPNVPVLVLLCLQPLESGGAPMVGIVGATFRHGQVARCVGQRAVLAEPGGQHDGSLHAVEQQGGVDAGAPLIGVGVVELVRVDVVSPLGEQLLGLGQRLVLRRHTDGWLRHRRNHSVRRRGRTASSAGLVSAGDAGSVRRSDIDRNSRVAGARAAGGDICDAGGRTRSRVRPRSGRR